MALDKEKLLAPRAATSHGMEEDTVEVEPFGSITVRGLNRIESMGIGHIEDPVERERHMIACAAVDPTFTIAEVATWQTVSAGGGESEIEKVTRRIGELSAMVPGAPKGDRSGVRRRPRR